MAAIETRRSDHGKISYRAKVRIKGCPQQSATFDRKTDAKRWAEKTQAELRDGRYFPVAEARKHLFSELVERYISEVLPSRPKNAANTKRHLEFWCIRFGHLLVADITPALIVAARNDLLGQRTRRGGLRSPATVVRYLASLSHAFSVATREWHWVDDNPVLKVSKPREPRGRERFLSDQEREQLLIECQHSASLVLYPVVVLALSTGMRSGEIMKLKWSDVDFSRELITLTETKNGTTRSVPLIGLAKSLIQELAKLRRIDTSLVFPGKRGDKPVELRRPWQQALQQAGIQNFRFHDLRHSAASYLAMNGATAIELSAVLGHKTLAMVKRYSHLSNNHTHQIVTAMNEKIFGRITGS